MTALCAAATNFVQLLLMRIGVGVGEAGSNPPSHSMIADLYPPQNRSTAMAIFGTGVNWGILIGFLVGGWINEWYGWRVAFLVVGLPGILIALLVRFTVKEPPRGYSESLVQEVAPPPFLSVVRYMWGNPILRNVVVAGTLTAFAGYASVIWVPIYLVRIHELGTGEAGTYLALTIGVGGAIGIYLGGRLADYLGRIYGEHWLGWIVTIAGLLDPRRACRVREGHSRLDGEDAPRARAHAAPHAPQAGRARGRCAAGSSLVSARSRRPRASAAPSARRAARRLGTSACARCVSIGDYNLRATSDALRGTTNYAPQDTTAATPVVYALKDTTSCALQGTTGWSAPARRWRRPRGMAFRLTGARQTGRRCSAGPAAESISETAPGRNHN